MLAGASCGDEAEKNNNNGNETEPVAKKDDSPFVILCKALTKVWVRTEVCIGDGFDTDVTKTQEPVDLDEVDWAEYGATSYEDALDNHRKECEKDKPEELVGCAEPNLEKMKACYDGIDAVDNCHGVLELSEYEDCLEICPDVGSGGGAEGP
jgi:hypothetical protein